MLNGLDVVEKIVFAGDVAAADSIMQDYRARHPTSIVNEVDRATFEATPQSPAFVAASQRMDALAELLSDPSGNAKVIRAVLLVILDEINVIRGLLQPTQAARTTAQMRTAVQNKINAGLAD